jgi:hypothetical protein
VDASRRFFVIAAGLLLAGSLSACSAAPPQPTATPAADARPITAAGVEKVLASMDTTGDPAADYRVDVPAFAASVVGQSPIYVDTADPGAAPTTFRPPDSPTLRAMAPAEASATVAAALAVYRHIESTEGSAAADAAMNLAGRGEPKSGTPLSASDQKLLGLLGEGAAALDFMFGQPEPSQWTWSVTGVTVVGTGTADVTYRVAAAPGRAFHFKQPAVTKRLRFEPRANGDWVLAGWPGYPTFERDVKASIEPSGEVPNLVQNWWDTLGAE